MARIERSRASCLRAVIIGGFRYYDTRPDDPNDIVPHEDRRVLRALKVFGAWTNLVDMKAGNTLDSVITENGKGVVRHYLQDVGSTFGTGANALARYDEGWEYLFEGELTHEAPRSRSGSSCSRGRPSATTSIPRSADSRASSSIRPNGSRVCRPRRSYARGPTTTSGRLAASWHFRTT